MHALGLEQMVSCLDDGRVKSFVIEVPPFSLEEIRARKAEIEAVETIEACRAMCCEPDKFDAWSCPYRRELHDKPEVVENPLVDAYVRLYEDARRDEAAAKKDKEQAKAELEKLMVFDDRIETQQSIVTKYEQSGGVKYDMDALADFLAGLGADMETYRLPEKKSPRMKITRKGLDSVPGEA
jgi:hypothetical protein